MISKLVNTQLQVRLPINDDEPHGEAFGLWLSLDQVVSVQVMAPGVQRPEYLGMFDDMRRALEKAASCVAAAAADRFGMPWTSDEVREQLISKVAEAAHLLSLHLSE